MGGRETQQFGDTLAVFEVFGRTFLEGLAEFLPEDGVLFGIVLGQVFQQTQDFLDRAGADVLE